LEVLGYICAGHANKETAHQLGIAQRTVAVHRYNLSRKLDAHNTAMVIVQAIRRGLFDPHCRFDGMGIA
jgi:DNA-binding CsgD family transcriptional regulator